MITEKLDHAAEAARLAKMADDSYGAIEVRNGEMAVAQTIEAQTLAVTAQVHATLALVEQQRIANVIALSVPQSLVNGGTVSMPSWTPEMQLRADIAAALGMRA